MKMVDLIEVLSKTPVYTLLQNISPIEILQMDDVVCNLAKSRYGDIIEIVDIEGYSSFLYMDERQQPYCIFLDKGRVYFVEFEVSLELLHYLIGTTSSIYPSIRKRKIVIGESFHINDNGDITFKIHKTSSYMDKYDETHKIIKENIKNKNYEAAKHNLAVIFSLIVEISKSKKYKKYRDEELVKARAFLINDFKVYLRIINTAEPEFDFSNFYIKNNYDKHIINIPYKTIAGLKKIITNLLLST